jgi:hypothetical protein
MKKSFLLAAILLAAGMFALNSSAQPPASIEDGSGCSASVKCSSNATLTCSGNQSCSSDVTFKSVRCDGVTTYCS